jgi:hypothetical protein
MNPEVKQPVQKQEASKQVPEAISVQKQKDAERARLMLLGIRLQLNGMK